MSGLKNFLKNESGLGGHRIASLLSERRTWRVRHSILEIKNRGASK